MAINIVEINLEQLYEQRQCRSLTPEQFVEQLFDGVFDGPDNQGCGMCTTKDGKHSMPCGCACHFPPSR